LPLDLVINVIIAGVLTGLVYGLMALGLSVIFGVVRVVNFAHGEMMTIAMYAAVVLFAAFRMDPFVALFPVAAAFFVFGYILQAGLINPFINRPEHALVRSVYVTYLHLVGGALGWVLHRDPDTYRYIPATIRRYPGAPRVAALLREQGFSSAEWMPVLGGLMAIHRARKA